LCEVKLPLDVELRKCGPVGISLEALSYFIVRQDIKEAKRHVLVLQNLDGLSAEAFKGKTKNNDLYFCRE
jgi:hypothetical protein